ncbi:FadR/GntR family transcriptional regulator [Pseudomonas chlororaphis]|uniref:FadR/GntR family transcriptional regulator n=1 Tax=Pseudomonas chlororaphis TaxID=587753 RepID=UPI00046FA1E2|nr:FadR/GntR family transcriptional regulator [Pseudomonas chlororaphis]
MKPLPSDLTANTLAEFIVFVEKRQYEPGERLPSERELSERFAVSRGTIREMLLILENLRYLERRPNSGIYMNSSPGGISLESLSLFSALGISLSSAKLAEAMEARRIIETQAVILACARRTKEDLALMERVLHQFDESMDDPNGDPAKLDYAFHMAIFQATHNTVLMQMVNPFYVMTASRRAAFFTDRTRCQTSSEQHRQLFQYIRAQDIAGAERVMLAHIGRVESLSQQAHKES